MCPPLDCSEVYVDFETRELVVNACKCIEGPFQDGTPDNVCMEVFVSYFYDFLSIKGLHKYDIIL